MAKKFYDTYIWFFTIKNFLKYSYLFYQFLLKVNQTIEAYTVNLLRCKLNNIAALWASTLVSLSYFYPNLVTQDNNTHYNVTYHNNM